jgi:hypothetical protein
MVQFLLISEASSGARFALRVIAENRKPTQNNGNGNRRDD